MIFIDFFVRYIFKIGVMSISLFAARILYTIVFHEILHEDKRLGSASFYREVWFVFLFYHQRCEISDLSIFIVITSVM